MSNDLLKEALEKSCSAALTASLGSLGSLRPSSFYAVGLSDYLKQMTAVTSIKQSLRRRGNPETDTQDPVGIEPRHAVLESLLQSYPLYGPCDIKRIRAVAGGGYIRNVR